MDVLKPHVETIDSLDNLPFIKMEAVGNFRDTRMSKYLLCRRFLLWHRNNTIVDLNLMFDDVMM